MSPCHKLDLDNPVGLAMPLIAAWKASSTAQVACSLRLCLSWMGIRAGYALQLQPTVSE